MRERVYDVVIIQRRLKDIAYKLRWEAIRNGDMETWRIARLIRDASTAEQVSEAKRRLKRLWLG